MADNINTNKVNSFRKQKSKDEMKKQLISFALMIGFTIIAFGIVATDAIDKMFVVPLLLILAFVQVAFQFYYFMHMKDKGHELPSMMIYGGIFAALLTIAALSVIVWW
ncbi:Cytochrome c oxidase subunit 4B [Oceanobacillus picturae]|jgi:cytochrome c oxidase subunit IV|uniref:Cytochrome c oxidase subunit 4B n=1 Tax=Oceanobacillus picturae TaxID=171693 RepID=W9AA34_9BACI|nr:cytochrome c oxidase subunit IVB [Oceanobacillus picturae]RIU96482.1 cytochrome c oxidase subunit IVB [Oceanobacillus picturae]CDO02353.1 Cytochrome c oxidase subunit 4B [Oceanobacillus picturae]